MSRFRARSRAIAALAVSLGIAAVAVAAAAPAQAALLYTVMPATQDCADDGTLALTWTFAPMETVPTTSTVWVEMALLAYDDERVPGGPYATVTTFDATGALTMSIDGITPVDATGRTVDRIQPVGVATRPDERGAIPLAATGTDDDVVALAAGAGMSVLVGVGAIVALRRRPRS